MSATRRPRRWTRSSLAGTFVLGFLLASATAAVAIWTVPVIYAPTNHAVAKAASLAAPTGATATANGTSAITVGWTPASGQLAGAQYRVTRTSGTGSPATVCTVAAATTSCQDTGLTAGGSYGYSVTAVLSAWQSNGASASATTDKAAQSISFTSTAPSPATAGGATYTVTATASSGLTVAFSLDATSSGCTISGSTVTFTAAGTCRVNANQAGNSQYLAAPQVQQVITVNAGNGVVGMVWSNVTVNGSAVTPTCSGTIGSTYSCTVSGGNNAQLTGRVVFANASGQATVFSTTQTSTINIARTGKTTTAATVQILANQTTSGVTPIAEKQGSNSAQITATFNGWTAVLIIN